MPTKTLDLMTPSERLASLEAWAEEQKYIHPGEAGTLGSLRNITRPQAYSGPVRYVLSQYEAPIAPPSYETAVRTVESGVGSSSVKRGQAGEEGGMRNWFRRRKAKKETTVTVGTSVDERGPPPSYG